MPASVPTVTQLRAAIAEKIFAIDPQIAVHDYERNAKDMSALAALYKSGDPAAPRLNGYHVRRVATREVFVDTGRWCVWHRWRIRGVMGMSDANASEKLFDEQIEAIRVAFRDIEGQVTDPLGKLILGTIDDKSGEAGIQVLDSKPVMFAGVLCHWAELGLATQHLIP